MHFKIKFIDSSLALNSFLLVERNVGVWLLTHPSEPSLAGDPDSLTPASRASQGTPIPATGGWRPLRMATPEISRELLEHRASYSCCFSGRNSGKRITSRIDFDPVSSMVSRSMPIPSPPVGGMP